MTTSPTRTTCEYDSREAYDTWPDGTAMCEQCYAETEEMATCTSCGTMTGRTEHTPLFGALIFRCTTCQQTWQ